MVGVAAASGALFGALALALLENPRELLTHWREAQSYLAGKTIVGALTGGLFAVEWTKRRLGITQRTGDLFALPLCVGIAIGRVGCFLTGLEDRTCGSTTAMPWGVDFGDGVRRHPTQVYEIVFLVLLAAVMVRLWRQPYLRGDLFKLFMISYFSILSGRTGTDATGTTAAGCATGFGGAECLEPLGRLPIFSQAGRV